MSFKGVYEYNIQNDEWTDLNTSMLQSRSDHACLLIDQKEIIVVGGSGDGDYVGGTYKSNYLTSSEIFNLKERTWRPGPSLFFGTNGAQFVKAKNGSKYMAYIMGGLGDSDNSLYSAVYGLSNDVKWFEKIGDLKKQRLGHVAFLLPDNISHRCVG